MSVAENDRWAVGQFMDEGGPVLMRVCVDAQIPRAFGTLLAVCWNYESAMAPNGMPPPDLVQVMDAVEENLQAAEREGVAVLTAVVTGNGVREWQWYVADPQAFLSVMNQVLPQDEPLPLSIRVQPDAEHEGYHRLRGEVANESR